MNDAEVYAEVRADLMRYATALVGVADAADPVSNVVTRVLEHPGGLSALDDPKPYLMKAVLNEARRLSSDIDISEPAFIAYHPDSNQWTYEGVSPLDWGLRGFNEWRARAFMAGDRVVLRSDKNLYISPPGWQPQGPPIPPNTLHAVEQQ